MCTIVALNRVREDYPLVLATNRDEFFARRTAGPSVLLDAPRTVGGRDLEAQGTWMGVTEAGLFVGITNQRTFVMPDRAKRSRGQIVLEALKLGEPQPIRAFLERLDGREYNSFNLMFGNATTLWVAYGRERERTIELAEVPPGIHVLPNDKLDSPDFVKVARAQELVAEVVNADFEGLSVGLKAMLCSRELPELSEIPEPPSHALFDRARIRELAALCVKTPIYGTRSSTIVALEPGRVGHYLYADGPPDETAFRDLTGLF